MKKIFLLISFLGIISCHQKNEKDVKTAFKDSLCTNFMDCENYKSPLTFIGYRDTLKIEIEKDDCGEWGGHKENIAIWNGDSGKMTAKFTMDSVSCENLKIVDGKTKIDDNSRVIIFDTTRLIKINEQELVNDFLKRVFELYLNGEELCSNAGTYFYIYNTEQTLSLKYWNSGNCSETTYGRVREIFLEK